MAQHSPNMIDVECANDSAFSWKSGQGTDIKVGSYVQVPIRWHDGDKSGIEAVWVCVIQAAHTNYLGRVMNTPIKALEIEFGDKINFGYDRVMKVLLRKEAKFYEAPNESLAEAAPQPAA